MSNKRTFEEILRKEGAEAAIAERDERKKALEKRKEELAAELNQVKEDLAAVDDEFAEAYHNVGREAGIPAESDETDSRSALSGSSNSELILALLHENGGSMYGPDLYKLAVEQGRKRESIYVAVSKLIREGKIKKQKIAGKRGSQLSLPEEAGDA